MRSWQNWLWGTGLSTWLAAIGTLLAIIVALYINLWRRPKLFIDSFKDEPPNVIKLPPNNPNEARLRLRVRNKGPLVARNCRASLEQVKVGSPDGEDMLTEPALMGWVPQPGDNKDTSDVVRRVDILAKSYRDLKLGTTQSVSLQNKADELKICCAVSSPLPKNDYFIKVTVYAENAEARTKKYKLEWQGHWDEIRMEE